MVASPDAIRALVEPPLASSGLELWDVEVSNDTVRILVDRPGGVDLDALAELAGRVVSPLLDDHPDVTPPGQFSLEVSSPGVERTLRRPDQYRRYLGQEVAVKTKVAVAGARRHQGKLVAVDEHGIVVAPSDGPAGRTVDIGFDQVERARTVLVWGPAAKPGQPGSKKAGQPGARRTGVAGSATTSEAVKRPAASGHGVTDHPVASKEKESE